MVVFFFKQKTAYEMRISDWSSDVCSSDLVAVKASDVFLAVSAYMGLAEAVDCPLHLGITEAGGLIGGTVKSAIGKIGRASFRERVCQYVLISVVVVSFYNKLSFSYLIFLLFFLSLSFFFSFFFFFFVFFFS